MRKQFFLSPIQHALNRYLKLDPQSLLRLKTLEGKTVAICLQPFNLTFQLLFYASHVELSMEEAQPATVKITGTPLQLMALALTPKERHRFFAEDVEIEGNVVIANEVIQLFDALDIDWEEVLAERMGDIPSHYLTRGLNQMREYAQKVNKSFTANIDDYLHHELEILPTKDMVENFNQAVDDLRMDADRLSARITYLMQIANREDGV